MSGRKRTRATTIGDEQTIQLATDQREATEDSIMKQLFGLTIDDDDEAVERIVRQQQNAIRSAQMESGLLPKPGHIPPMELNEPWKRKNEAYRHMVTDIDGNNIWIWDYVNWLIDEDQYEVVSQPLYNEIVQFRNEQAEIHNEAVDELKSRKRKTEEVKEAIKNRRDQFAASVDKYDYAFQKRHIVRQYTGQPVDRL